MVGKSTATRCRTRWTTARALTSWLRGRQPRQRSATHSPRCFRCRKSAPTTAFSTSVATPCRPYGWSAGSTRNSASSSVFDFFTERPPWTRYRLRSMTSSKRRKMAEDLDRIVPLRATGTRPPLYCVHAVSGSAYAYSGLTKLLGADQPVYGIEAPGFDNDRQPVSSLPALADESTEILRAFSLQEHGADGGYRLLGWSLGGILAFEMAKR